MTEDKRIVRTRRTIEQTLLSMLYDMPLDKVTVTELCTRAHVDRGTFYRHYAGRDDLAEKLAERLLEEFNSDIYLRIERIIEGADSREILRLIIRSIDEVGSDLVVLQDVKIRGKDVRTRIRHIAEGALRVLSSTGILGEDPETEAWAITTIVLDYPLYAAEIGHRANPATFIMAIHEITDLYYSILIQSQKRSETPRSQTPGGMRPRPNPAPRDEKRGDRARAKA